jgi:hypothetical protein
VLRRFAVLTGFVRVIDRSEVATETGDALSHALADILALAVAQAPVGLGLHIGSDVDVGEDVAVVFAVDDVANLGSHFVLNEVLRVACLQEATSRVPPEIPSREVVRAVGGFAMAGRH